jgi:hypothetical protein
VTDFEADSSRPRLPRRHTPDQYEAAFEDFLRSQGVPFIRVEPSRRTIFAGARLKSFDFVIYPPGGINLLVDVKGRRGAVRADGSSQGGHWENWVPQEDLQAMSIWERTFGPGFRALLVFAYWLTGPQGQAPARTVHVYREEHYTFLSIPASEYAANARTRSQRWKTVSLPAADFRSLARPIESYWAHLARPAGD